MNEQRILVIGAGYTGMLAAIRTAVRTRRHGATVTLVNPTERFTERLRMHQIATGQSLADLRIPHLLRGSGVIFVKGFAEDIDLDRREVRLDGARTLAYDTLIFAAGSATPTDLVPGVAEHGYTLNGAAAGKLAGRLAMLPDGSPVVVGGNGLTGVEAATEIAEQYPELRVSLLGRGRPGSMMGPKARAYLDSTLERLGIEVRSGEEIIKLLPDAVELAGGELIRSAATLWTTGFRASPLAAASGLAVDAGGRIEVDGTLRSTSHPEVFAIGDAAAVRQKWGMIHGTCQSGMPTAAHVADTIARLLRGKEPKPFRFAYMHQPVSLGRRDAVIQFTTPDDSPSRYYLKGRAAVLYKETVTASPAVTDRLTRRLPGALVWRKGGKTTR